MSRLTIRHVMCCFAIVFVLISTTVLFSSKVLAYDSIQEETTYSLTLDDFDDRPGGDEDEIEYVRSFSPSRSGHYYIEYIGLRTPSLWKTESDQHWEDFVDSENCLPINHTPTFGNEQYSHMYVLESGKTYYLRICTYRGEGFDAGGYEGQFRISYQSNYVSCDANWDNTIEDDEFECPVVPVIKDRSFTLSVDVYSTIPYKSVSYEWIIYADKHITKTTTTPSITIKSNDIIDDYSSATDYWAFCYVTFVYDNCTVVFSESAGYVTPVPLWHLGAYASAGSLTPSFTAYPEGKNLVYTGDYQDLLSELGSTNEGTIYYRCPDAGLDEWSTTPPKGKNADHYNIEYYIKGDNKHIDSNVYNVSSSIDQKEIHIEWSESAEFNFRTQYPQITNLSQIESCLFEGVTIEDLLLKINYVDHSAWDAGTYNFEASIDHRNYTLDSSSRQGAFTITPLSITKNGINIHFLPERVEYTGSEITPGIRISDEDFYQDLVEGTDYTVEYADNINIGTAKVIIKGIGNYSSSRTETFEIVEPAPFIMDATADASTINLNVYCLIDGQDVSVTYDDVPQQLEIVQMNNRTYGKFTITSVAKEMADVKTLSITTSGTTDNYDLSVSSYLKAIIDNPDLYSFHRVAKAILHYGAAAQKHFNYGDTYADEGVGPVTEYSIPSTTFDNSAVNSVLSGTGIEYAGMTLTFEYDISLTMYFYSADKDTAMSFVQNNVKLDDNTTIVERGNYIGVTVTNIPILDLEKEHTLTVNGSSFSVTPIQYMANIYNKNPDGTLSTLCKKLYTYYMYAKAL